MFILTLVLLFAVGSNANLIYYQEGESATLECSAEKGEVQYWLLHGKGKAVDNSSNKTVYMNKNGTLHFENVSKSNHEGNHVCVVRVQETIEAFTVEMDVRPLPLHNLWETQYRGMFVTGFIASFVCLVLFIGFCFIQKYRWRPPLSKIQSSHVPSSYINPAMEENDECNIRM